MAPEKDLVEFPDVQAKLHKPTKQSAFEKQKAEAEAKRKREEAETAAVYKDFLKSFDDDDDDTRGNDYNNHNIGRPAAPGGPPSRQQRLAPPGAGGPGASRRHFGASGLKSGPGSLGPAPAGFGKKRSFQDFASRSSHRDESQAGGSLSVPRAFRTSDDEDEGEGTGADREEERAVARPTLRLTNLPPGMSPAAVKALVSEGSLTVESVRFETAQGLGGSEKRCAVAIAVLSPETPANDIEAAVSALQNRYLGYGHYLSLHRHLSSTAVASSSSSTALGNLTSSNADTQPFGAKPVEQPRQQQKRPDHRGGFAPPPASSYNTPVGAGVDRASLLHVPVRPPGDIKTTKLINMVIEGVLDNGPEFEALLMSRPEVQREEKWAWIWDARSQGGTWYRWRLWEVVTGAQGGRLRGKYVPIFDGSHAWKAPDRKLPYEYTTELDELASDSDYNSSDDEDVDGEREGGVEGGDGKTFLNPLEKAKLTHLLARLPTTLARLRKGDIARVSAFAIQHASRGVDEVVDLIVSNVERPLALTGANPQRVKPEHPQQSSGSAAAAPEDGSGGGDVSAASLVALYVVSDILSSSSTSGVRHAWRFRQLFETALRERRVFERLGGMAERFRWGRLRADKWKRSVQLVLNLWEGWCVFSNESQELFVRGFENPPGRSQAEGAATTTAEASRKSDGRWKVVEEKQPEVKQEAALAAGTGAGAEDDDVAGEPIDEDDVEGEPIVEDDVEGEPIDEDDIEGEPIDEDDVEGEPIDEDDVVGEPMVEDGGKQEVASPAPADVAKTGPPARKPRMRAADMFPDSDGSDG